MGGHRLPARHRRRAADSGWAANRFGARRVYMTSLVLFTLGSVLCGFAWNIESLVVFRVLQGIGGGLMLPVGQIILVRPRARAAGPRLMSMHRRLDHPGPGLRPDHRRPARRARRLGVDLLREHPDRHRRRRPRAASSCPPTSPSTPAGSTRWASRSSRPASSGSPTGSRRSARPGDRVLAGARPAHRRSRARDRRLPRALLRIPRRCSTSACSPTRRSPRPRSRRSASAPRCSGR